METEKNKEALNIRLRGGSEGSTSQGVQPAYYDSVTRIESLIDEAAEKKFVDKGSFDSLGDRSRLVYSTDDFDKVIYAYWAGWELFLKLYEKIDDEEIKKRYDDLDKKVGNMSTWNSTMRVEYMEEMFGICADAMKYLTSNRVTIQKNGQVNAQGVKLPPPLDKEKLYERWRNRIDELIKKAKIFGFEKATLDGELEWTNKTYAVYYGLALWDYLRTNYRKTLEKNTKFTNFVKTTTKLDQEIINNNGYYDDLDDNECGQVVWMDEVFIGILDNPSTNVANSSSNVPVGSAPTEVAGSPLGTDPTPVAVNGEASQSLTNPSVNVGAPASDVAINAGGSLSLGNPVDKLRGLYSKIKEVDSEANVGTCPAQFENLKSIKENAESLLTNICKWYGEKNEKESNNSLAMEASPIPVVALNLRSQSEKLDDYNETDIMNILQKIEDDVIYSVMDGGIQNYVDTRNGVTLGSSQSTEKDPLFGKFKSRLEKSYSSFNENVSEEKKVTMDSCLTYKTLVSETRKLYEVIYSNYFNNVNISKYFSEYGSHMDMCDGYLGTNNKKLFYGEFSQVMDSIEKMIANRKLYIASDSLKKISKEVYINSRKIQGLFRALLNCVKDAETLQDILGNVRSLTYGMYKLLGDNDANGLLAINTSEKAGEYLTTGIEKITEKDVKDLLQTTRNLIMEKLESELEDLEIGGDVADGRLVVESEDRFERVYNSFRERYKDLKELTKLKGYRTKRGICRSIAYLMTSVSKRWSNNENMTEESGKAGEYADQAYRYFTQESPATDEEIETLLKNIEKLPEESKEKTNKPNKPNEPTKESDKVNKVFGGVGSAFSNAKTAIGNIPGYIENKVSGIIKERNEKKAADKANTYVTQMISAIKDQLRTIVEDQLRTKVKKFPDGEDLCNSLFTAITDCFSTAGTVDIMEQLVQSIKKVREEDLNSGNFNIDEKFEAELTNLKNSVESEKSIEDRVSNVGKAGELVPKLEKLVNDSLYYEEADKIDKIKKIREVSIRRISALVDRANKAIINPEIEFNVNEFSNDDIGTLRSLCNYVNQENVGFFYKVLVGYRNIREVNDDRVTKAEINFNNLTNNLNLNSVDSIGNYLDETLTLIGKMIISRERRIEKINEGNENKENAKTVPNGGKNRGRIGRTVHAAKKAGKKALDKVGNSSVGRSLVRKGSGMGHKAAKIFRGGMRSLGFGSDEASPAEKEQIYGMKKCFADAAKYFIKAEKSAANLEGNKRDACFAATDLIKCFRTMGKYGLYSEWYNKFKKALKETKSTIKPDHNKNQQKETILLGKLIVSLNCIGGADNITEACNGFLSVSKDTKAPVLNVIRKYCFKVIAGRCASDIDSKVFMTFLQNLLTNPINTDNSQYLIFNQGQFSVISKKFFAKWNKQSANKESPAQQAQQGQQEETTTIPAEEKSLIPTKALPQVPPVPQEPESSTPPVPQYNPVSQSAPSAGKDSAVSGGYIPLGSTKSKP